MVKLRKTGFDPWQEAAAYQAAASKLHGKFGATALFVGTMRDFNNDEKIDKMVLEYYPGMTEKQLELITSDANRRWNFLDCLVIHRVGEVLPNDPIVLVAVWTAHRGTAFDACRFIIEQLKSNAPFWKQEFTGQNEHWVEKNTSGY